MAIPRFTYRLLVVLVLLGALVPGLTRTRPALAAGVVGDGTPESCTSNALAAVLAGGGDVTFNCGPNPYTIVTDTYVIDRTTHIDGGGLITLSGEHLRQIFLVQAGGDLTLDNLTLADGGWGGDGGTIGNYGTLTLNNSIIRDSSGGGHGGAIYNEGTLVLNNSQLLNNTVVGGRDGGGLYNAAGPATFNNSVVRGNAADNGGGIANRGSLTLDTTIVMGNVARAGYGGGLALDGDANIYRSVIENNSAAYAGGGASNALSGLIVIEDTVFAANSANPANPNSSFGGGISNAGVMTVTRVTLRDNRARNGGAIATEQSNESSLTVRASTLYGNTAVDAGGGLFAFGSTTTLENSTFSGNSAGDGGGLYAGSGSIGLTNVTLLGNAAQRGGAIYKTDSTLGLILANTIVALSTSGNNCELQNALTSNGYNLSSDASCGLAGAGDQQSVDPLLGPLVSNGGPTFTHHPRLTSPAIDAVAGPCPATDQRGQPRPQGGACDSGAVEVDPSGQSLACGGIFDATADAYIAEDEPNAPHGSGAWLRVGKDTQGSDITLLDFDLAQTLPPGAVVEDAAIEVTLQGMPDPAAYQIEVRDLAEAWNEQTVTWNAAPAYGTSYGSSEHHRTSGTLRIDVTTLVQRWTSGAVARHGLALLPAGDTNSALTFASRDLASPTPIAPRLVVHCAPAPAPPATDQTGADQQQAAAADQLKQNSTVPAVVQLPGGAVRFADFRLSVPASAGADPLARAQWFLDQYRDLLRLDDPTSELQLIRRSDDGLHLFFRQRHAGIPVFGAELVVHTGAGDIVGVSGSYLPRLNLPPEPSLTAGQAEALALADAGAGASLLGDTQLRYINLGLLGQDNGASYLAWQVHVASAASQETVFIDANGGALLFRLPRHNDGFDLDLEDGNNDDPQDLCSIWDDDDIGANDDPPDSVNAFNNTLAVYNYWRGTFGRDSYDGDGEQIELNIHVYFNPINASYGYCDLFFFSPGTNTRDITGHEFTHAVDNSEGGLIYSNQSGALDESFADVFGQFTDNGNWTIGEGSAFGVIRDMSNPPAFGHPDRLANYVNTTNDNGGVHTNSGIPNKAAFLLNAGGTFNGITTRGIGQAKAQRLFYNVLVNRVWGSTQFIDLRNLMIAEATQLANSGTLGFSKSDVCSVRNAYAAVGLGSGDRDCDGIEDNVDPDADGDYIPNNKDNCPNLFNAFQDDLDKDGVGDACDADIDGDGRLNNQDNCAFAANPFQADWNNDGEGDACDDSDGDARVDSVDNCRTTYNPNQRDIDFDGLGDACDPDIDGDARPNNVDNCPNNYNPDQADTTEVAVGLPPDGIGDVCDSCPTTSSSDRTDTDNDGMANPCDPDDDNDGLLDGADNCPLIANPNQLDTDKNGVGFACDPPEIAAFYKRLLDSTKYKVEMNDLRFPIPICPQCGTPYLPDRFESVLTVQLPVAFKARIVDAAGTVVAKTKASGLTQVLNFQPAPFAISRGFGAAQSNAGLQDTAQPLTAPAPDEARYYLEIVPAPGTDLSQSYDMTVSLSEQVRSTHLPLVMR